MPPRAAHPQLEQLRVVQVVPTLLTGGLERASTELAIGLVPLVERVVVCSAGGSPFEDAVHEADIPFERIPRPVRTPHRLFRAAYAVARVLRRERPHVVHAHNPTAGAAAALARMIARAPETAIVTTFHGVKPHEIGRARRALALASDLTVGVSPTVTETLRTAGLASDRSATVFNGVDVDGTRDGRTVRRELGVDDAELVVTVARYVEEKNYPLLLDALAMLVPRRPRLRALFVGVGPLENALREEVSWRGLDDAVTVTGQRVDAVDIAGAADVVVLPSDREAMPLALLEAMALARPVVATRVGGITDVVTDGDTGLLVPPGDAEAMAAAIGRLLGDPDLRRRLGASARTFTERTATVDAMVAEYARIYVDVVRRRLRRFAQRRRRPFRNREPHGNSEREPEIGVRLDVAGYERVHEG